MDNEPGAAVLSIFEQLVDRVKQMSPKRTDGKPINTRVYSQLTLGMPISRADYMNPWTPVGGASLAETFSTGEPGTLPGAGGTPPAGVQPPSVEFLKSMQAAWKTALLCRTMLQVVKDERYEQYPIGRQLDFAYDGIIHGMTAAQTFELSPELKERVDRAEKILYKLDDEGNIIQKSPVHENYLKNAERVSTTQADFEAGFTLQQRDAAEAQIWPTKSVRLIDRITRAKEALVAERGVEVEAAFDTLGAIGRPIQEHMIAKAKREFDAWNLGFGGVPTKIPYSFVMPSNWADPENPDGFARLQVSKSNYTSFTSTDEQSGSQFSWRQHAEQSSGSGGVSFGFMAFGAEGESSSTESNWQNSDSFTRRNSFSNSAKGLTIDLEYGLCTIVRPWLVSDLFFMKGWFMAQQKKSSISDGTIDGQIDSMIKLMPMIPQQFLVVRNVSISAMDWGQDGQQFEARYGGSQGSTMTDQSSFGAAGGVCLGFINFGGTASHAEQNSGGQGSSWRSNSGNGFYGTRFEHNKLTIPGTQIVAFLSDIVPQSPEMDDPALQV